MNIIRDLRHKKKFIIDDIYIDKYARICGIYATGVYASLCRHADRNQKCFPSKKLLAQELKISERKAYDGLKILEKLNIMKIESQGRKKDGSYKSNEYTLFDSSQWHEIPTAGGAVGTEQYSPQACGAYNRKQGVPNKETQEEGNTDKETHSVSCEVNPFSIFWENYPKKEGRKHAEEVWKKKKLDSVLPLIIAFMEKAKDTYRWKGGYSKNPTTFLNGEHWNDDLSGYDSVKGNKPSNLLLAPENKYEDYQ